MPEVEIESQTVQSCFVHKRPQVRGVAHLAVCVLHSDRHAGVMRVQDQMLERTESRVALSRIGCFPRAAHVQNQPRVRQILGHVRSEEHTSELQSQSNLVCRLLLEKK